MLDRSGKSGKKEKNMKMTDILVITAGPILLTIFVVVISAWCI